MTDALYRNVRWSHVVELPVMGVPITFASNAAEVLDAVEESFGSWRGLAGPPALVSASGATVRIAVTEGPERAGAPSFRYRAPGADRLLVAADGSEGVADTLRRESIAFVERSLLGWRAELADGLIEPLTLFQLGALDRQPLHAAAVLRGGVAILLEGPSGVGKSTLTYAASRRGFTPLTDEATYVQMRPALRVWSRRARIHLRPEAAEHFPELEGRAAVRLPGGKTRIVVPAGDGAPRYAEHAGICLLERGRRPRLERISPERVATELEARLESGFDLYADTVRERAAAVARAGAWALTLGDDPSGAAALLDDVVRELARAE